MKNIEKNSLKILITSLCIFLLISLVACNDRDESEAGENEMATTETMETTMEDRYYFSEWDANSDNYLDTDEYSGGFFHAWDTNNDNQLDESEWMTGYERMGQPSLSWSEWDLNADGFINEGEYRTGNAKAGWYSAWDSDQDNRLSEEEYNQGMAGQTNRNE